jgi:hypothetical protein
VVSQSSQWLQFFQATAAIATTVGVLIALYLVVIRDPRQASEEHEHHVAKIEALQRAQWERAAAQARKVVASCAKTPIFGDSSWTVRIDNGSNALATLLAVEVIALDPDGVEIPHGCKSANGTMAVDQALDRSVQAVLSGPLRSGSERPLPATVKQAIRDALVGHIVDGWPRTIPPNGHAVLAHRTSDPSYKVSVTIDYEDEAGYQWRRTDTRPPTRLEEVAIDAGGDTDSSSDQRRDRLFGHGDVDLLAGDDVSV